MCDVFGFAFLSTKITDKTSNSFFTCSQFEIDLKCKLLCGNACFSHREPSMHTAIEITHWDYIQIGHMSIIIIVIVMRACVIWGGAICALINSAIKRSIIQIYSYSEPRVSWHYRHQQHCIRVAGNKLCGASEEGRGGDVEYSHFGDGGDAAAAHTYA